MAHRTIAPSPFVRPQAPQPMPGLEWIRQTRYSPSPGPIIPTFTHAFRPFKGMLPDQCGICFGWYDDPRHE